MNLRGITSRGKLKLAGGLLALTVGVGAGGAAVYAKGPHAAPAAGKTNVATELAQQLNVTPEQFLAAEKAVILQRIDAQVAAGHMTADQAQKAKDRVNSAQQIGLTFRHGERRHGPERRGDRGQMMVRRDMVQAVTTKLGITPQELMSEMRSGKSLAEVAQAHNVSRDDLKATMTAALKADLDKGVAAGKLTQAKADEIMAKFNQHVDKLIDHIGGKGKGHPTKPASQ